MIKKYKFIYDNCAEAHFMVDTKIFTIDRANENLNFYSWDYDSEGDLISECMKKYAMICIVLATVKELSTKGVINEFSDKIGFLPIDGSFGILLMSVSGYTFDESSLSMIINQRG